MRYTQEQIEQSIKQYRQDSTTEDKQRGDYRHSIEHKYLAALETLSDDTLEDYMWAADGDRTGTGTRRLPFPVVIQCAFGPLVAYGTRKGLNPLTLPVLTSRKIWWRGALAEALWMWKGQTSLLALDSILPGAGEKFWGQWAYEPGAFAKTADRTAWEYRPFRHIGLAYGHQFGKHLAPTLERLKADPTTRRACFTLHDANDLPRMALQPCHGCWIQFDALPTKDGGRSLFLSMTQRSSDFCIGVSSNILAYYYLLRVAAAWLGFEVGGLSFEFNDAHLYQDHVAQAKAQTENTWTCEPPKLRFAPGEDMGLRGMEDWRALSAHDAIQSLRMEWFSLDGEYKFAGDLKYNVAK